METTSATMPTTQRTTTDALARDTSALFAFAAVLVTESLRRDEALKAPAVEPFSLTHTHLDLLCEAGPLRITLRRERVMALPGGDGQGAERTTGEVYRYDQATENYDYLHPLLRFTSQAQLHRWLRMRYGL